MLRPVVLVALMVAAAGCIKIGVPEPPPPPVEPTELPDGQVPADDGATTAGPGAAATPPGADPDAPPAADGCAGPGPRREVGDHWEYRPDDPVETRFAVEAREARLGQDTFRLNLTMDEMFYEIPGYAEDPRYELRWVCTGNGALVARREAWNATMGIEVEYESPCQVLRYPLVVGATWSTTCSYRQRSHAYGWSGPFREVYDVHVVGNETVWSADHSFEAVKVWTNRTGWDGETTEVSYHDATNCADAVVLFRLDRPSSSRGLETWECH